MAHEDAERRRTEAEAMCDVLRHELRDMQSEMRRPGTPGVQTDAHRNLQDGRIQALQDALAKAERQLDDTASKSKVDSQLQRRHEEDLAKQFHYAELRNKQLEMDRDSKDRADSGVMDDLVRAHEEA